MVLNSASVRVKLTDLTFVENLDTSRIRISVYFNTRTSHCQRSSESRAKPYPKPALPGFLPRMILLVCGACAHYQRSAGYFALSV